jgi:hypothetical protein
VAAYGDSPNGDPMALVRVRGMRKFDIRVKRLPIVIPGIHAAYVDRRRF